MIDVDEATIMQDMKRRELPGSGEPSAPPSVIRALGRSREGLAGITVGTVVLTIILFGRFVAPYPPDAIGVGPSVTPPSSEHPFGTDELGRDVLSRFLTGGDTVLVISVTAVVIAFLAGGALGMLSAYRGGWIDRVTTRAFDVLLTLPPLLVVLVVIAGAGTSSIVLVLTIALIYLPRTGRFIRGATHGVVTHDYVAAAQARGETTLTILLKEVAPNIVAPAAADFALRITYAVIFVATLNFLGLGAQPPAADWGLMVADSRTFITLNPVATIMPAVGIAALSVSFNLIADALTRQMTRDSERVANL